MRSKLYYALLWAALIGLIGLLVHGLLKAGIFEQSIWTPLGIRRLTRFSIGFVTVVALLAFTARRLLVPLFAVVAILFTAREVGPVAVFAVVLFLFSSFVLGRLLLRCDKPDGTSKLLALLLGIAIWQFLVSLAVRAPINYPLVYLAALALPLVIRPRLTLAFARECVSTLQVKKPPLTEYLAQSLVLYLATVYLLAALMPEISSDGLAMHLTIPAFVADHHYWHFDAARTTWALMPMAGNWSFTIAYMLGGEFAAHLTNFAMWMIVAALLYHAVSAWLPRAPSFVLTAALLSTPTAQLVTGSLLIENFLTAMLFGSLIALDRFRSTGRTAYLLLGCTLAGTAAASKFGALAFLVPWVITAVVLAWRRSIRPRYALAAAMLLLAFAAPPYLTAYLKTGNPIFPFQNHVFRSPLYDTSGPLVDLRFRTPLKWDTLYDLAFYTGRYMEGQNGSFGYHYFLFLPLCLLLYPARWPWLAKIALALALIAVWLITREQFNLRYLYPALPWIMLAIGGAWAVCRNLAPSLFRALVAVCLAAIALNVSCLATSNWYHKDFCMTPFKPRKRDEFIAYAAPGRKLVEYMNRHHSGEPVLFMCTSAVAGLRGRAYLDGWHNYVFLKAINQDTSPESVLRVLRENGIRFLIVPVDESAYLPHEQNVRGAVKKWGVEEYNVGGFWVARISPASHEDRPLP